jgi:hypothetical protein
MLNHKGDDRAGRKLLKKQHQKHRTFKIQNEYANPQNLAKSLKDKRKSSASCKIITSVGKVANVE